MDEIFLTISSWLSTFLGQIGDEMTKRDETFFRITPVLVG